MSEKWQMSNFRWDDVLIAWIFSANTVKQQFVGRHVAPPGTHYSDSEPTSFCSHFFMLCAYKKKQQMDDFPKNEDFSFSENNLNIKWYERKVNILKQAQW